MRNHTQLGNQKFKGEVVFVQSEVSKPESCSGQTNLEQSDLIFLVDISHPRCKAIWGTIFSLIETKP